MITYVIPSPTTTKGHTTMTNTYSDTYPTESSIEGENAAFLKAHRDLDDRSTCPNPIHRMTSQEWRAAGEPECRDCEGETS